MLKKWLLFVALLLGPPVLAQTTPASANLTAADSGACTTANACLTVNLNTSSASAVIQLAGTWSATIQFEGATSRGGTFVPVLGTPVGGTTGVTSASTTGAWRFTSSGLAQIRARVSTFTSGIVAVTISNSTGSSGMGTGAGGGGGGGSAPAIIQSTPTGTCTPIAGQDSLQVGLSNGLGAELSINGGACQPLGSSPLNAVFIASNQPCTSTSNCVQWVDDDSTDNCGTATTNFVTAVNAYAGPGKAQVMVLGSGTGKAYKFSSCSMAFPSAAIVLNATIDCAQSSGNNCIALGGPSPAGIAPEITGTGTFLGGANLTNAVVEILANTNEFTISGVEFLNTGAGNATLGNCTNYAVLVDNPVAEGWISHVKYLNTTAGTCAFSNPNGNVAGTNTIHFEDNVIGWPGNIGASTCGSVGIIDGGSYGEVRGNVIYGAGMDIRLQGIGHRIISNEMDSALCLGKTKNAIIHFGPNGSSQLINAVTIADNIVQVATTHTTNFIAQANDSSSSTIQNWTVHDNINASTGGGLFDANYPCTTAASFTTYCAALNNKGLSTGNIVPCGNTNAGWQLGSMWAQCSASAQSANIGATLLWTPGSVNGAYVTCQVVLTRAATTSSTLPQCVLSYTDFSSNAAQSVNLTPVWASGTVGCSGSTTNTVGNSCVGKSGLLIPKSAVAVNYSTVNYASAGGTTMQYEVFLRVTGNNDQ